MGLALKGLKIDNEHAERSLLVLLMRTGTEIFRYILEGTCHKLPLVTRFGFNPHTCIFYCMFKVRLDLRLDLRYDIVTLFTFWFELMCIYWFKSNFFTLWLSSYERFRRFQSQIIQNVTLRKNDLRVPTPRVSYWPCELFHHITRLNNTLQLSNICMEVASITEVYFEPIRTSTMELFCENNGMVVNYFRIKDPDPS